MYEGQSAVAAAVEDDPSELTLSEIKQVAALLTEALAIADVRKLAPEIGARLEELIGRVEQELEDHQLAQSIEAFPRPE